MHCLPHQEPRGDLQIVVSMVPIHTIVKQREESKCANGQLDHGISGVVVIDVGGRMDGWMDGGWKLEVEGWRLGVVLFGSGK